MQPQLKKFQDLLSLFGENFLEVRISKEPTKIEEKLSVNSTCNSIYKMLVSRTDIFSVIADIFVLSDFATR